jgi:hypothetical protein
VGRSAAQRVSGSKQQSKHTFNKLPSN